MKWDTSPTTAAQAILHQIFHDPVGREELRGGGNVLALHDLANDLVFLLRDVKLIQPADDLDFLPVFFVDLIDQFTNQRIRM